MTDFEKIYSFENLYRAHLRARLGKRKERDVIDFESNLSENLVTLSESIRNKTYKISGYYSFKVYDPKERDIHALYYRDRVVQHCICDEVLEPILDKTLIYDNCACRKNKGTHFSMDRLSGFLREFYKKYGTQGCYLKIDIRKYFNSIDHGILKEILFKRIYDNDVLELLYHVIDSYEFSPGKGLPLGNQTSQWFAILYLDRIDRLIKEDLHIHYYTRYMDDMVLLHQDKEYLCHCRDEIQWILRRQRQLDTNEKTKIFPIKNGVNYLGFHFYLTETGKVVRKIKQATKKKYKKKIKLMQYQYKKYEISFDDVKAVLNSYRAHLSHGNCYRLNESILHEVWFRRKERFRYFKETEGGMGEMCKVVEERAKECVMQEKIADRLPPKFCVTAK